MKLFRSTRPAHPYKSLMRTVTLVHCEPKPSQFAFHVMVFYVVVSLSAISCSAFSFFVSFLSILFIHCFSSFAVFLMYFELTLARVRVRLHETCNRDFPDQHIPERCCDRESARARVRQRESDVVAELTNAEEPSRVQPVRSYVHCGHHTETLTLTPEHTHAHKYTDSVCSASEFPCSASTTLAMATRHSHCIRAQLCTHSRAHTH